MNAIAALAAKEAVVASGIGASFLPGVAPSAVDGFAAGTLLSGVCFLLIVGPRRGLRRSRLAARDGALASASVTPDANTNAVTYAPAAPVYPAAAPAYPAAVAIASPLADESAEIVVPAEMPVRDEVPAEPKSRGYQSKHRLTDTEGERRTDTRRAPGRHAAPTLRKGGRSGARISFHPLAVRD